MIESNTSNKKHDSLDSHEKSRRRFLQYATAGLATLYLPHGTVFARPAQKSKKFVWVVLRGALDSLHTVVPINDPNYSRLRPKLSTSFSSPLLPLDDNFSLHPALKNLHHWYQQKEFMPIVAVGSGYGRRSHFDGQDFLESGKQEIDQDSGWLARAMNFNEHHAIAISRSTPISLRDTSRVNTWYPSGLKDAGDELYQQLSRLYQDNDLLTMNLNKAMMNKDVATNSMQKRKKETFPELAVSCAKLMVNNGVDTAMLSLGGWDTHNNQANRLNTQLSDLDLGLASLKKTLGEHWNNTVVAITTEFGRTAKENGTGGTDHGTGTTLFLAGGAVKGGKVMGTWPGLACDALFESRDLMPTSQTFSWLGNILTQHWQLTPSQLENVFPGVTPYKYSLIV